MPLLFFTENNLIYLEYKCLNVRDFSKDRAWPQKVFTCSWSERRVATPDKLRKKELLEILFLLLFRKPRGFK